MYPRRRNVSFGQTFAISIACLSLITLIGLAKPFLKERVEFVPALRAVRRDLQVLEDENVACRKVHRAADECAWIKTYCEDDDVGLLSYLNLYYCRMTQLKSVAFTIILIWSALLFSTIGIAASDFFCVNLSTIANLFGMSESMAGVTFLAFGNGSPDVFSTFAAIRSNSGSLAVGELIGAAGFITAVVSGSMALVRPFKVARRSFVRDVGFFIVAVSFSMIFVANGSLELWECAAMVGFYVFYVVVVVTWHWWLARRRKRREQQDIARGFFVDTGAENELDFEAEYHDDEEAPNVRRRSWAGHPTETDLNALVNDNEQREDFDELDEETERDKWMGELSSKMRITKTPGGERRNTYNPIRPSLVGALEFQGVLSSLRKSQNSGTFPLYSRRFSDGPGVSLGQQRSKAHSTTSDPHPDSRGASREPSPGPSDTHSQADGSHSLEVPSGRGRAKSANAADLLGLSPSAWRGRQRSRSNLSSPRPESSRYSDETGLAAPDQAHPSSATATSQPQGHIEPPLLLVEPPNEEPVQDRSPAARPRAGTEDLLAPPSTHASPKPYDDPALMLDGAPDEGSSKPQLRITPPSPQPDMSQFPPLRSPSLSSDTQTPRSSNFFHGETIPSPESMRQPYANAEHQHKPLPWWPYSVFAAPETVYRTLFPTLYMWREKNWVGKLAGLVSAPSFFLLTITLPVVEPEANESNGSASPQSPQSPIDVHKSPLETPSHQPSTTGPNAMAHVAVSTDANQHDRLIAAHERQEPYTTPLSEAHPHAAVQSSREWNRWLVLVQCFTAPYFILLATWANFFDADPSWLLMPSVYCLIGSTVACALLFFTTRPDHPPRLHFLLCFAGFAVSVTWISSIANEVVGVLKAIGVIFNISDAILGLTIFAVGNSMGDLVADITVARLGYPVMALSACFGGPMLNILLGIGLSGLYMVINKADHRHHKHPDQDYHFKPYKVEVSTTLMVSAVALLVTLVGLLIVVPLNRWWMDRKIAWGLILLWIVATAGNLGVELSGIGKAEA
ncbi:MAG: hypothetical protein Q9162_005330 [Coniocarpon cinnabarinum]